MTLSRSDEFILLAVWRLQRDAYGASILEYLQRTTAASWSIAGVYAPLKRLARRGLLRSRTGKPTPERGGRRRRYYELTALGRNVLVESRHEYESMWAAVSVAPGPPEGAGAA